MKTLVKDPAKFNTPKGRPSGHQIGAGFAKDNGGAIPSNLIQLANSESNGRYSQLCKAMGVEAHPARFPAGLPEFFVKFLTEAGDTVLDIFAGSGTTGEVAQRLGRNWQTCDLDRDYVRGSLFRFVADLDDEAVRVLLRSVDGGGSPLLLPKQRGLFDLAVGVGASVA